MMKYIILLVTLFSIAISQDEIWVRTGQGKVKLKGTSLSGDSVTISASASVDSSIYASKSWTTNQFTPLGSGGESSYVF